MDGAPMSMANVQSLQPVTHLSASTRLHHLLSRVPLGRSIASRLARARDMRALREEFNRFERLSKSAGIRFALEWKDRWPCLGDKTPTTEFDRHYVYHTSWAA